MEIQEINISNNQKKQFLKIINNQAVLFEDDNGDLVLNIQNYAHFAKKLNPAPAEEILGDAIINYDAAYLVMVS